MHNKNLAPAFTKGMNVASAKAPPAVKMAPAVKQPQAKAGLSKSHNPANHLSAMPYANGGMVKGKKGGC